MSGKSDDRVETVLFYLGLALLASVVINVFGWNGLLSFLGVLCLGVSFTLYYDRTKDK